MLGPKSWILLDIMFSYMSFLCPAPSHYLPPPSLTPWSNPPGPSSGLRSPCWPPHFHSGPEMIQLEPEFDHSLLCSHRSCLSLLLWAHCPYSLCFSHWLPHHSSDVPSVGQFCKQDKVFQREGTRLEWWLSGATVGLDTSGDVACHPCTSIY